MTGSRRTVVFAVSQWVSAPAAALSQRSVRIETLPWTEAERLVDTATVVMILLGVARMNRAPNDYHPGTGGLTRDSATAARDHRTWSRTGTFGNATLATQEKGRAMVEAQVRDMVAEVDRLRQTPIPH